MQDNTEPYRKLAFLSVMYERELLPGLTIAARFKNPTIISPTPTMNIHIPFTAVYRPEFVCETEKRCSEKLGNEITPELIFTISEIAHWLNNRSSCFRIYISFCNLRENLFLTPMRTIFFLLSLSAYNQFFHSRNH